MAKVISPASANSASVSKALTQVDLNQNANHQVSALDIAQDQAVIGGYGYQIIRQQSQRIAALKSSVLADKDPDNLHKMRIATRRLTAAVLIFSDTLSIRLEKNKERKGKENKIKKRECKERKCKERSAEKTANSVRELTQALGGVRDMDVMKQWLEGVLEKNKKDDGFSKKEKKVIQTLLKTIKKRRKKRVVKLEGALQGDRTKKLLNQFKKWAKQPSFTKAAQAPSAAAAASKIVAPIANLLQHPAWLMASHSTGQKARNGACNHLVPISDLTLAQLNQELEQNGEQLHDLRKQIKLVRYQAEFFRGLFGIAYTAQVREFRKLQTILGGLQDQIVISQFLTAELGKSWAEKLPTIAADFQSSRLAMWKQWQPYQQKYLNLRSRLSDSQSPKASPEMSPEAA